MDHDELAVTGNASPWDGDGLPVFLGSPAALHARLPPITPAGTDASPSAADAPAHDGEHPIEGPPAPQRRLQPQSSRDALQEAMDSKKQRRLQMVDGGGGMVGYRHATRQRKDSVYTGLAPSSRSTKKQLAAADARLCKRPSASTTTTTGANYANQQQHNSNPTTHGRDTASGAAPRKVRSDNSTSSPTYKDGRQHGVMDTPADDATPRSQNSSSAVLLQTPDTMQAFSPHKLGRRDTSGGSADSRDRSTDAASPTRLAELKPSSRGQQSQQRRGSKSASALGLRPARLSTARPAGEESSTNPPRLRGVASFRRQPGSRLNSAKVDSGGDGVVYADDVPEDGERHRPIRRLSSSRNLPVIWMRPPPPTKKPRSARKRSAKATPKPLRAPSGRPAAMHVRVPASPRRPSSSKTPHKRQATARRRSTPGAASPKTAAAAAAARAAAERKREEEEERRRTRAALEAGQDRDTPPPLHAHTDQLPALAAPFAPLSPPSHRTPPSGPPPTLDEVLQRHRADATAAQHAQQRATYTYDNEARTAPPVPLPAVAGRRNSTSLSHPYNVPARHAQGLASREQQIIEQWNRHGLPYDAEGALYPGGSSAADYKGDRGGGGGGEEGYGAVAALPRTSQLDHGRTPRSWRAPPPPHERNVVVESLGPLLDGPASPMLPHLRHPSTHHRHHLQQRPGGDLFRSRQRREIKCGAVVAAVKRVGGASSQRLRQHVQASRYASGGRGSDEYADVVLSDPGEEEEDEEEEEGEWVAASAGHNYPVVGDARTGAAHAKALPRKRPQRKKQAMQRARLYPQFAPYMAGASPAGHKNGGRGRGAAVHAQKNARQGRHQQRGQGNGAHHLAPIDYASLAAAKDPLDYLLGRHGFWGEATTRC
ncbi:hypothetical protein NESM_000651000 [Novymonas esmeraldas]|uniref:Uncharacterized protein n=1 Tax=Novymonas esmeraldas TaxID=1808958 RepID=A0AAW0ESE3_9TRYP